MVVLDELLYWSAILSNPLRATMAASHQNQHEHSSVFPFLCPAPVAVFILHSICQLGDVQEDAHRKGEAGRPVILCQLRAKHLKRFKKTKKQKKDVELQIVLWQDQPAHYPPETSDSDD